MNNSNIFTNTANKVNTVHFSTHENLLRPDASYYAVRRKKYLKNECVDLELAYVQYRTVNECIKPMCHIEM